MLRIIAGKYKSRRIDVPRGDITRPTTDKVREAIMSALGNIENKIVLDLFSGSGALGIEALSRNASYCIFCDNSLKAINTIKNNLKNLEIENGKVYYGDYQKILEKLKKENMKFDLIFIDPPYCKKEAYKIARKLLLEYNLLNDNALLVEESDEELKGNYGKSKDYKYGIVHVRITREVQDENSNISGKL